MKSCVSISKLNEVQVELNNMNKKLVVNEEVVVLNFTVVTSFPSYHYLPFNKDK